MAKMIYIERLETEYPKVLTGYRTGSSQHVKTRFLGNGMDPQCVGFVADCEVDVIELSRSEENEGLDKTSFNMEQLWPTGTVLMRVDSNMPDGWAEMDGVANSRENGGSGVVMNDDRHSSVICHHEWESKLHPGCGIGCADAHYADFCKKCGVERHHPEYTHQDHSH